MLSILQCFEILETVILIRGGRSRTGDLHFICHSDTVYSYSRILELASVDLLQLVYNPTKSLSSSCHQWCVHKTVIWQIEPLHIVSCTR